jgi:hypothetical protein
MPDLTEPILPAKIVGGPHPRDVIAAALRTYREEFRRVAGTAFVVFGTVGAADAVAVIVIDGHAVRPVGVALASVVAGAVAGCGVVLYAGILDRIVGAHLHGHPDYSLRQMWRTLPIRRLLVADILLATATLAGLALGLIPGMIVFTLWSLVGPLITIEDRPVISSFRRSWQLVRRNLWLTLFLVTLPIYIEQGVLHAIHYAELFPHPALPAFLFNGLLGAVIGSIVGLIEVVLAHELIIAAGTRSGASTYR